ncbi:MAG TPA: 5-formyltetrahydrofolate cyclo-ligase, partial [Leeuwenhoekiella sp.]|nr:5-formyltetrahydrofolate cyclo-ligase [Leeuwenhoekiella sp.]HBO29115.1 5-formyltetrahydrofolate cyclo-ligase [Leeuwenhoekiella sp.]
MEKKVLRAKYKQLREALTSVACDEKSLAIANNLLQLDIWSFETYHVFLTIEKLKEINTEYLLNILNGKDKNIVVSKSDFEA